MINSLLTAHQVFGEKSTAGFDFSIKQHKPKEKASLGLSHSTINERLFLLFMAILTQAFFTLVRSHLVSFAFFSAWHVTVNLLEANYFFFLT